MGYSKMQPLEFARKRGSKDKKKRKRGSLDRGRVSVKKAALIGALGYGIPNSIAYNREISGKWGVSPAGLIGGAALGGLAGYGIARARNRKRRRAAELEE